MKNPLLFTTEENCQHYNRVVQKKNDLFQQRFAGNLLDERPHVRRLVATAFQTRLPEKSELLVDLGCGSGFYFPLLSKHARRVVGIDVCPAMIAEAQQVIEAYGLDNCEARELPAETLPFEDNSVDVVHSWDFLHHTEDPSATISEVARVLKRGGQYLAFEPNLLNPSILWYHSRRRSEWRLFRQNQFTLANLLRSNFVVDLSYDNTIISFLTERTLPLWKLANRITSLPAMGQLSFRYVMDCRKA